MDKINFLGAWFGTTITGLIFSVVFFLYLLSTKVTSPTNTTYQLYQALPLAQSSISESIEYKDARSKIVENFFKSYKSELANYSEFFITVAEKYQIDFRLLPAISMQESNGGVKQPADSFNPFGYGIYGSKAVKFTSWEEAIETVGKALREDYINQGLNTPEKIMTKYTPPSLLKGGTWANGVRSFMEELR